MRRVLLCFLILSCTCAGQGKATKVEVSAPVVVKLETQPLSTPIAVKIETTPPTFPQLVIVQGLVGAVVGGFLTLLAGWLATGRQQRHEMRKWRAEKKLDVLGQASQLIHQTKRALTNLDARYDIAVKFRNARTSPAEIGEADKASGLAKHELNGRLAEFFDLTNFAAFSLTEPLQQRLLSLHRSFTALAEKEEPTARAAQLEQLDREINEFSVAGRKDLESV
jgi:hypothetical protein